MRDIFHSDEFSRQCSDLELRVGRLQEFLRGVTAKLRRNPEFGTKIRENPDLWLVGMPDILPEPLCISYTFDERRVILLSIWISEETQS